MFRRALLGGLCAASILAVSSALAQSEAPPVAVDPNAPSVTSYPPSFFADYHPFNAMDMVGRLPGFSFDGGNDARGFAGTGGNVLLDGQRPPSRTDSLRDIIARIPAGSVERIDLVRGGAGGIDMDGKTVIANVIRKKSTGLTGAVNGELDVTELGDIYSNGQLQLQRRSGSRSIEGSVGYTFTDGVQLRWREQVAPDGTLLLRSKTDGVNLERGLVATGTYEDNIGAGQVRLNTKLEAHRDGDHFNEILSVPGGEIVEDFHGHRRFGELGARYTRKVFGTKGTLELIAFQQLNHIDYGQDYDTPDFTSFSSGDSNTGQSILSGKVKLPRWRGIDFETGLEGAYNFDNEDSKFILNDVDLGLQGDVSKGKELRGEAFVTGTWSPKPKLIIEGGVRYEHSTISADGSAGSDEKTLSYWKPRGVVTWTPNKHHQVVLRAERLVDQLSFDAFSASASFQTGIFGVGNPDIVPPQTWLYEARYEYRFGEKGSLLLVYTYEDQHDVLTRVSVTVLDAFGLPQYFDITRNAAEVHQDTYSAVANLPLDKVGVKGGLLVLRSTWIDSRVQDPVTHVERSPSNINANEWSLNFSQSLTGSKFSWGLNARGPQHSFSYAPRSTGEYNSDYQWGGGITYRPTTKLNISVGLNTINGGSNHIGFVLYNAPRDVGSVVYEEQTRRINRTLAYLVLKRTI